MAHGQVPGLRSPAVKYRQINTDTIRIIYPVGLDAAAQRVAFVTTQMARLRPFSTGAPLRKIDVLLQNATDIPNGYVGLGPWRSEFYLTPPQSSFETGSIAWQDLLALHEFRHVQQLSAMRKGISSIIYYLFGEEAYSGAVHLAVPNWFTEGDAVMTETALSAQGRGRVPAFTNAYREMVADGKYWPYAKARNGSLKEYVPSHYPLGFLLINYGREQYGQDLWDSVSVDAAAYKGILYSFSKALRQRTGLGTREFYREAMNYYRDEWKTDASVDPSSFSLVIPDTPKKYADYSYPAFATDGTLYAMVEQFDQIAGIYRITDEGKERVVNPGFQTEPYFSLRENLLCWTELRRHPRWWREDYSVIVVYDINTRQRKTLTHGSSYFMPAISPNKDRLVALFDNDMLEYSLHILSASTGEVLMKINNPENIFYTFPQWTDDERWIISAARYADGKMALTAYDLEEERQVELVSPSYRLIGRPYVSGEWVYFTMTEDGTDQIFRIHRSTKYLEQVTWDSAPSYQPAINHTSDQLVFARFSLEGKKLLGTTTDSLRPRLIRTIQERPETIALDTGEQDLLSETQPEQFPSSKYPLLSRPIRLHSWSLYSDDPLYGIELLSENTLGTLFWRNGWEYNQNSGFYGPFSEVTFGLWYPELVAGYSGTRVNTTIQGREFIYWQHVTNAGIRIPFFGYHGPYSQYGSITSRFNHINTTGDFNFKFNYLSHTVQFGNLRKQAFQDAESRFSQAFVVRYLHSIDTITADQFQVSTDFTIPSVFRTHFLWFEFDYRHELVSNDLRFGDVFDYAHGYDPISSDRIWRAGVSYNFPIAYPDFSLAGLVYLKRIRLSPFYDVMRADGTSYRAVGSEIIFDINGFNVEPVSFGVRWSHQLDGEKSDVFALILPMGL